MTQQQQDQKHLAETENVQPQKPGLKQESPASNESAYDRFEREAEEFRRETGMMAPGKDQPAALGGPTFDERWERWVGWLAARRIADAARTVRA